MTKDNTTQAIDPRYDPVYQRGFAGAATPSRIHAVDTPRQDRPAPLERSEPARAAALRPGTDERVDSFVVPPAKSISHEALPGTEEPETEEPETAEPEIADEIAPESGTVLRGNPWVATLWVIGVLLLTAGFFGTWRSQSIYVGATPINDMNEIVTFQVLQTLSPSLVLVGLLVLGGLLFLHAVTWRTRRRAEDD